MTASLLGVPPEIAADAKILIVDSESAAKRAQALLPSYCVLWPSEAGALDSLSMEAWIPLQGCDILLWPSNIPACRQAMTAAANALQRVTDRVRMIYVNGAEPPYFSAADMGEDWDSSRLIEWARARVRPYEKEAPKDPMADIDDAAEWSEQVPAEQTAKRGKPRSKSNGQPPKGKQIEQGDMVSWESMGLDRPRDGAPYPNLANAQRILAMHPKLIGCIWYDEFHDRIFQTLFQEGTAEWMDHHDTRMAVWIQSNCRLPKMGVQTVQRAVDEFARLVIKNEPKEWMLSLVWDKTERLATLMADGFGAKQNDYTAAVGRCFMVGMVARVFQPGCQVDYMPVFEGKQGIRKSSALHAIGGKWFSEVHEDVTKKDFFQCLQGRMLVEFSELHAFRRQEVERIKGIITCRTDRYRDSYARRAIDHPRKCVFSGTTNRDDWVQDDTGARRFWPITCGEINYDYIVANREQIFAEAVNKYVRGEPWWDIDPELAAQEQNSRRDVDSWTEYVLKWASAREHVSVDEVLSNVFSLPPEKHDRSLQMRVASILRVAKWIKTDTWWDGRSVKRWVNPNWGSKVAGQSPMF